MYVIGLIFLGVGGLCGERPSRTKQQRIHASLVRQRFIRDRRFKKKTFISVTCELQLRSENKRHLGKKKKKKDHDIQFFSLTRTLHMQLAEVLSQVLSHSTYQEHAAFHVTLPALFIALRSSAEASSRS